MRGFLWTWQRGPGGWRGLADYYVPVTVEHFLQWRPAAEIRPRLPARI